MKRLLKLPALLVGIALAGTAIACGNTSTTKTEKVEGTKSLTQIITEFRALQTKDAVSPESLGYILQRIVDLLCCARITPARSVVAC